MMAEHNLKYKENETLSELVADIRNKMGVVTGLADIIKLSKNVDSDKIKDIKENQEKRLLEVVPILKKLLHDFEKFDLG